MVLLSHIQWEKTLCILIIISDGATTKTETKGRKEESLINLLGDSNSGYLIFKYKILLNK